MLIQFVLIAVLLIALVVTWRRASQDVISRIEAFIWSLVWIGAGVIILLPQTTTVVAHFFGVGRGADFVIYGSVVALFVLVFKLFISLERLEQTITKLVQHEALKDFPPKE